MAEFTRMLAADPDLRAEYRGRTPPIWPTGRDRRGRLKSPASRPEGCRRGSSACTRSSAHALAAGPGVNPIGDLALARMSWSPAVCECVPYGADG